MLRKVIGLIIVAALAGHAGLTIAASGNAGNTKKISTKKRVIKRVASDPHQLQSKAENDGKRHEYEARYHHFQMMQQSQQRGYQKQQPHQQQNTPQSTVSN